MKASDVMTVGVVVVGPETSVEEAARLMVQHRVSGLPVMEDGRLVGIITEGDLLRRMEIGTEPHPRGWLAFLASPGRLARDYVRTHARQVADVMSTDVKTVGPGTMLAEVIALMESRRIKRLPVVENDRLIGIVSRADLVRALAKVLPERPAAPAVSDAEIRSRFLAEVDRQVWAPRTSVDARVENGALELRGVVTDERIRRALIVLAENTDGVRSVRDTMLCADPVGGVVISGPGKR